MCHKDLPAIDDLSKRNAAVFLPVLHRLLRLHKDHEVVVLALEMNLGLSGVTSHVVGFL